MRAIFYTLSALTLMMVVALLASAQHQAVRAQQSASINLIIEEKFYHTYWNIMSQLPKAYGTDIQIQRGSPTTILVAFNSTVNATEVNERHYMRLLSNLIRFSQFSLLYGEDELGMENVNLDIKGIIEGGRIFSFTVEPYHTNYTWEFDSGLNDLNLTIAKGYPLQAGNDYVQINLDGTVGSAVCCLNRNITFGSGGNVTVVFNMGSNTIGVGFSQLDRYQAGKLQLLTGLSLPETSERIHVNANEATLTIQDGTVTVTGSKVKEG